ncbi:hypothetical protein Hypma_004753 [Hypsizygus marmoreus]|uniref:Uncharacterized protein n=1 Tax=Hypsizygus marmoreus TaxID=39966 RepID=A0A369J2F2_HYPMA|nr:hypothetical protein Hypma_004753 [Hypsizygus marmoreus]
MHHHNAFYSYNFGQGSLQPIAPEQLSEIAQTFGAEYTIEAAQLAIPGPPINICPGEAGLCATLPLTPDLAVHIWGGTHGTYAYDFVDARGEHILLPSKYQLWTVPQPTDSIVKGMCESFEASMGVCPRPPTETFFLAEGAVLRLFDVDEGRDVVLFQFPREGRPAAPYFAAVSPIVAGIVPH